MKFKLPKSKKALVVIVTIVLLISISFTIQPKENPNFFERGLYFVFTPIQTVVRWPINKVKSSITFFSEMKYYAEENERLTEENSTLKEQIRKLEAAGAENEELRDLLNLRKKYETEHAIVAEIISYDASAWFKVMSINKGRNDGVNENMIVLTPKGLVGKVTQVSDTSAKVTTILDVNNVVSARITKTGDLVTTKGDMNLSEKGLLRLNYVMSDTLLNADDVIETSGMGGIYPKGIFIGTIKEVIQDSTLTRKYALLEPGVDFNKLNEVLLINGLGGEES
ncbi:MAG: rod shape-determining protein MreC [Clostridia bacterium]|nr:rod shape-determining protein MreC [Clostridia bacterium]